MLGSAVPPWRTMIFVGGQFLGAVEVPFACAELLPVAGVSGDVALEELETGSGVPAGDGSQPGVGAFFLRCGCFAVDDPWLADVCFVVEPAADGFVSAGLVGAGVAGAVFSCVAGILAEEFAGAEGCSD